MDEDKISGCASLTLAVGDIVFNDGSATPYSVIDARTDKKCTPISGELRFILSMTPC